MTIIKNSDVVNISTYYGRYNIYSVLKRLNNNMSTVYNSLPV